MEAFDPDDDAFAFSAVNLPDGAELNGADFVWTPDNEQAGNYDVTFIVTDDGVGNLTDEETITISVGDVNRPPVLTEIGDQEVNEGDELTFTLEAFDPDDDAFAFSAQNLPEGAELNGADFVWTPDNEQAGEYDVTFIVTDDGVGNLTDEETITITVRDVNRTPFWVDIPETEEVDEGKMLRLRVTAYDPDGDEMTLAVNMDDLPGNPVFDELENGIGSLDWRPAFDTADEYEVVFTVSDDEFDVEETVTITVVNVNREPVLTEIGDKQVNEGEELTFTLEATDPDDDGLTFSVENLPDGAELNGADFTWSPRHDQAESYEVTFIVTDDGEGELSDEETITISVDEVNRPPEWTEIPIDVIEAHEIDNIQFDLTGIDPDNDDLTIEYESFDIPEEGIEFTDNGNGTASFSWQTDYNSAGQYSATFTLSDGDFEVVGEVDIQIDETNREPVWDDVIDYAEVDEGNVLQFTVEAYDPDKDDLTYEGASDDLPEGWELTDNGDNTATFRWTTGFDDASDYTLTITALDDEFDIDTEIAITVNNTNRDPFWEGVQDDRVVGYVDEDIVIEISAIDPDDNDLEIDWQYLDDPDDPPEPELVVDDEYNVTFTIHPTRYQAGDYRVEFTAQDEEEAMAVYVVEVEVLIDHYRYPHTGREHTIRVAEVDFFGGEVQRDEWDELDEIGIRPPECEVSGSMRFENAGDPPWVFIAWGDDPQDQEFEGFHTGDEFEFVYWSHDEGVEYNVRATLIAGDERWRLAGLTVFELFIGPELSPDTETLDFGLSRTGQERQLTVTLSSTGSVDLENLELSIDGQDADVFGIEDDQPFDLAVGEENDIAVNFNPDAEADYQAILTVGNDDVTVEIDLIGSGVRMDRFVYEITDEYHTIEVVDADIDGEPLEVDDEIGVFIAGTNDCGGAVIIGEDDETPWQIIAWASPQQRVRRDFEAGDQFEFRIWDEDAERMEAAVANYIDGPEEWESNGTTVVSLTTRDDHYNWYDSGISHTLTVTDVDFLGSELSVGDEIAVITPRRLVAGGVTVGDELVIEAYGDDPNTEDVIEGFQEDDNIYFRVWNANEEEEYLAIPEWGDGPDVWTEDGESDLALTVVDNNLAPVWRNIDDQNVDEGEELSFVIIVVDQNEDPLNLSFLSDDIPDDAEFTDNGDGTGEFVWIPDSDQQGERTATFEAFDGLVVASLDVQIMVRDVNRPPTLEEIGDQEVDEGELLSFVLVINDPDGDEMSCRALGMPFGATLDGTLFRWSPTYEQATDDEEITFVITDLGQPPLSEQETIHILVNDVNRPPVVQHIDPVEADEGTRIDFTVRSNDPDGDDLEFTAENLPDGAEFEDQGDGSGQFTWQTDYQSEDQYQPQFIASDDELSDDITVEITVHAVNVRPVWEEIGNREVEVGDQLDLNVQANDPDPEDQEHLNLVVQNLPQDAEFTDNGIGEGSVFWEPGVEDIGIYPNVQFTVTDPHNGTDLETITISVFITDEDDPVISEVQPGSEDIVCNNQPTISAEIIDEGSGINTISFTFDHQEIEEFHFNQNSGHFEWQPDDELAEGDHSFHIRATDHNGNAVNAAIEFTVNSTAGTIEPDDIPRYTLREAINISGDSEPFLQLELIELDEDMQPVEMLHEAEADAFGRYQFRDVQLVERWNWFSIEGIDDADNEAEAGFVEIFRDIEAPTAEYREPQPIEDDPTPEIEILIEDTGIGVDLENSIELSIDGEAVEDFTYQDDVLMYDVRQPLADGAHTVSVTPIDRLGNAPYEPFDQQFIIDSRSPLAGHRYLAAPTDTISNRQPEVTIAVSDPLPSSGINVDEIVLTVDDNELGFEWYDVRNEVYFDFENVDPLDLGLHELSIIVPDRAGNVFEASGEFFIGEIDDDDPPDFDNLYPPPGGVAGLGDGGNGGGGDRMPADNINADTISFVISDIDAGVNWETVMMIINDEDTLTFENGRLQRAPGGRVMAPMRNPDPDADLMPGDMPGLEEGLNEVNVFGADNEDNEDDQGWQFFHDAHDPDPPELEQLDFEFINEVEIEITGTTGEDTPDYPDNYNNNPSIKIYRNEEIVVEEEVEYEEEFNIPDVLLVEGENIIEATVTDGGGNESDFSEPIVIFVDLVDPVIEDFEATGGNYLATPTPEFSAVASDVNIRRNEDIGAGIDSDDISLIIGEVEIPVEYDEENEVVTAQVEDELEDGDYVAVLTVIDRAGNEVSAEFSFNINTEDVVVPEFNLAHYTGTNRVYLSGTGVIGTRIDVYLGDDVIGSVGLADSDEFEFVRTIVDLPDTTFIRLRAINRAGVEGELSDPQMLVVDNTPPLFSESDPELNATIDVGILETISVFVEDLITGIDGNGFSFRLNDEEYEFIDSETDTGYWLEADVSEIEFFDNQTVEITFGAQDLSVPTNQREYSWNIVTLISDPPVVDIDEMSFDEDEQLSIDLFNYISDPDNAWHQLELETEIIGENESVEASLDTVGYIHLSAAENWFGNFRIAVQVTDPGGLSDADTFIVAVNSVNDPPHFTYVPGDTVAVADTEFEVQVRAEDVDFDEELTFSDNTDLFDIGENGVIAFDPDADLIGLHRIVLYVHDSDEASDTAVFNIQIREENLAIEIVGEIEGIEVLEDADPQVIADLSEIFHDPEEQQLSFIFDISNEGLLLHTDQNTNNLIMSLTRDFYGEVDVTVTADDRSGSRESVEFHVNVIGVNDPPRQIGILPERLIVDEDPGELVIAALDTVFYDVEDDDLTFDFEGGDHLRIVIDDEWELTINPDEDWFGVEVVTLTVDDGVNQRFGGPLRVSPDHEYSDISAWSFQRFEPRRDESISQEITVEVRPVNDAPRLGIDDPFITDMLEDQDPLALEVSLDEMFSDPDPDDEIEITWEDREGPIELSFDQDEEHIIVTLVIENWNGEYDYPILASDGNGGETELVIAFSVAAVNDPPEVVSEIENQRFDEDSGPWEIADLDEIFTDVDEDELLFDVIVPNGIEVVLDDDNVLTFNPVDNFSGEDIEIIVSADDGVNEQMFVRFSNCSPVSPKPGINYFIETLATPASKKPGYKTINHDSGPVRTLRSVGRDPQIPKKVFCQVLTPDTKSKYNNSERGFNNVRRDDAVEDIFLLTVNPANDPPVWIEAPEESILADESDRVRFTLTAEDVDLEWEGDEITLTMTDDGGTVERGSQFIVDENIGTFIWQTDYQDHGEYTIVFDVEDQAGESDIVEVNIILGNVNRPPEVVQDIENIDVNEDAGPWQLFRLNEVFDDPDGEELVYEISVPQQLGWELNDETLLTITAPENFNAPGGMLIEIIAEDSSDAQAIVRFELIISSINDLPTPFNLLEPADSAYVSSYPLVTFSWGMSIDVIEGDEVHYVLIINIDGDDHLYRNYGDSTFQLHRNEFCVNEGQPTDVVWEVWAHDGMDSTRCNEPFSFTVAPMSVQDWDEDLLPKELTLGPLYPNPFNEVITIPYAVPVQTTYSLTIHDPSGRLVKKLDQGNAPAGRYRVFWDGCNESGVRISSGLYIVRLVTPKGVRMQRMVLLK
ncbi:MAG: Ig-like domain-containing protein [Candidatus Hatepunaea meridiana]|nr:Ig-like domain-containing protein [Candidatus Hatepunaea meridiana]